MPAPSSRRPSRMTGAILLLVLAVLPTAVGLPPGPRIAAAVPPDHLVISEVVTGGASASDEIVELYNPTDGDLPLEGLELVYASATGATITRRASWPAGSVAIPAHRHLLLANDAGAFASIADVLYAGGMAATGGSVALRIQGAATAIDAVGWGTASSSWLEGAPAPAPAAGESLERLPGGASGSTTDTDDNAADFVVRPLPEPQNLGSAPTPDPVQPPPTPAPTAIATPTPSAAPSASLEPATPEPATPPPATPTPTPTDPGVLVTPIATARALPDGTAVTIEGVALTSADFADGGGFVADATGGIAVLSDAGAYARGRLLRVTGELDDRFGQRTIRAAAGGIADLGPGTEPAPVEAATGSVTEAVEGRLAHVVAAITGSASVLSAGTAFDIDDGSGVTRLVVGTATGIDVSGWRSGTQLDLVGVIGQRDSSGTGAAGYRVQPRDPTDIRAVGAPASPTPAASTPAASGAPSPDSSPPPGVISIADARAAAKNARVTVRGTVTLPTGLVDAQTAAIQDASGAILLRLADEAGSLALGELVEVAGTRSTKSGMETLRVMEPPRRLAGGATPSATPILTGEAGESLEARLVTVRGGLVAAARRASSGTVSFEIDDGSGPLRVVAAAVLAVDREALVAGAWVEVHGVLGQETTGSQPTRGYRVWPRAATEIRLLAGPTDALGGGGTDGAGAAGGSVGDAPGPSVGLGDLVGAAAQGMPIGATLVVGSWPELGVGGLLWDGERLVAVSVDDAPRLEAAVRGLAVPVALELRGLTAAGVGPARGLPFVMLGRDVDAVVPGVGAPAAPATMLPPVGSPPRWVSVIGRMTGSATAPRIETASGTIELEPRCDAAERLPRGAVAAVGVAVAGQPLVVPCGGLRHAPTLVRTALAAGPLAGAPAPASDAVAPRPSPSTPIAVGMLLAAALALGGTAAWARLRPANGPEDDAATRATGLEAAPNGAPALAEPPTQPVLTLVRLPHERGP